jgi:hypothetical protein
MWMAMGEESYVVGSSQIGLPDAEYHASWNGTLQLKDNVDLGLVHY